MFSQSDFGGETKQRLLVIVMSRIGKFPLTPFHRLLAVEKAKFNEFLNQYIRDLPEDNWEQHMTDEFNQVCSEEVFTSSFKPELYPIHLSQEI